MIEVFLLSIGAGLIGSLLGLGGGIIVVPALTLLFGLDIRYAIGASIVSVIATSSGAAAAYVAMTRGRHNNTAHLVAESVEDARKQWVEVFGRDRADLGPAHAQRQALDALDRYGTQKHRRPDEMQPRQPFSSSSQSPGIGF